MILIGEKLNGSIPAVAEAIARRDDGFLQERVRIQAAANPDYIDVCASVSPEQEPETLAYLIRLAEETTDIPLCLDSPDPVALKNAMGLCRRPGLINSVSLEGEKLDVLFPLIADSGWSCIALLCDSAGIPDSAEKRLSILDEIIRRAEEAGIPQERLFVDPLVVSLSTSDTAALTFFACVRAIRNKYPRVHITSGLSNSSFGLPGRKYINQAFLLLAMEAGMDSAILDPTNHDLMALMRACDALLGRDEFCRRYMEAANPTASAASHSCPAPPAQNQQRDAITALFAAVENGKSKEAAGLVEAALAAGVSPERVLNQGMVDAMAAVGERFSRGEAFVPQMLMSAKTMKKGVEALRPSLTAGAISMKGKVVIGTVAGDIHDIGKNLVSLMMESAGFEIVDLGVDVSTEDFLAAAQDPAVRIVALSALLTTSMPAMAGIVAALKDVPQRQYSIFVGGAPITAPFAQEIGADIYTKDAASAAAKARELAG